MISSVDCIKRAAVPVLLALSLLPGCQRSAEDEMEARILEGMVRVPAGEFIMGSDEVDTEMLQQRFGMRDIPYQNEHPKRTVSIPEYHIDMYETTNKDYKEFLDGTEGIVPRMSHVHLMPPSWKDGLYPEGTGEEPVVGVNWNNARSYCGWRGRRLPTEAEWEKAARGTDGNLFPWGNEFDDKKANSMGLSGGVAPVGEFEGDVSPYGVRDMAGNVSEWVEDWYAGYPGNEFQSDAYGERYKVIRGWYWGGVGHYSLELFYRSSNRHYMEPHEVLDYAGFRCAY